LWKGEDKAITGLKKARIQLLLRNDISLCAYHLPLDAHPELGNNAQLAIVLGINQQNPLDIAKKHPIVFSGELAIPQSFHEFQSRVESELRREPFSIEGRSKKIKSLAW
jgi:putative NIF3 family GTP cyclohydrolase 1 type 2